MVMVPLIKLFQIPFNRFYNSCFKIFNCFQKSDVSFLNDLFPIKSPVRKFSGDAFDDLGVAKDKMVFRFLAK